MTTSKKPFKGSPDTAILALAGMLYELGKAHIAAGKPVSKQDIAAMNRARNVLNPRKSNGHHKA